MSDADVALAINRVAEAIEHANAGWRSSRLRDITAIAAGIHAGNEGHTSEGAAVRAVETYVAIQKKLTARDAANGV